MKLIKLTEVRYVRKSHCMMASLYYNYQNLHGFALSCRLGFFFNKTSLGLPILNIKEKKLNLVAAVKRHHHANGLILKVFFQQRFKVLKVFVSVVLRHMDNSFQCSTDLKSSRTARAAITGTAFLKRKKAKI